MLVSLHMLHLLYGLRGFGPFVSLRRRGRPSCGDDLTKAAGRYTVRDRWSCIQEQVVGEGTVGDSTRHVRQVVRGLGVVPPDVDTTCSCSTWGVRRWLPRPGMDIASRCASSIGIRRRFTCEWLPVSPVSGAPRPVPTDVLARLLRLPIGVPVHLQPGAKGLRA